MNTQHQENEEVFLAALKLLEEGKSPSLILEAYPTHQEDLRTFLTSVERLESLKDIKPSRQLLQATLAKMPILSPLSRSFSFWKIGVSVLAVAVLIIGGTTVYFSESGTGDQAIADSASNTSDAALNQAVATIDSQLGGLDSDQTQVDQAVATEASFSH
jgi:anti-sigma-K factor RskA